jgi:hypothetical protein
MQNDQKAALLTENALATTKIKDELTNVQAVLRLKDEHLLRKDREFEKLRQVISRVQFIILLI